MTGKGAPAACGTDAGAVNPVANIAASYATNQTGPYTNFNPSTTPSPVIPLDWIKLNGSASMVTGTPTYLWQLVSQPTGSTTSLVGANSVQAEFQALVSGNYVVTLTVKDASGCIGTETVTISVVPTGAVHLELTWNTSCGDSSTCTTRTIQAPRPAPAPRARRRLLTTTAPTTT